VRAPRRPAPARLCRRPLDQPRIGRTRPARAAPGRRPRRGAGARGDDARAHGPSAGRRAAVAALRPRRQRGDLVGQPRRTQHQPDRRGRSGRRAAALRPRPGGGGLRREGGALPRRRGGPRASVHRAGRLRRRRLHAAHADGGAARPRRAHRMAGPRLQGAGNPAGARRRFPDRTERAAHLAARPLHVHRPAQRRADLHRDPVHGPARRGPRRPELRRGGFRRRGARAVRTRLPRRAALDPGARARLRSQPRRQPRDAVPGPLAPGGRGGAAGRRRARDGAVPWPGHELRIRGLRRARPHPGRGARPGRGVRRLRGRAQAERAGDPAHGAGQLHRDARPGGRSGVPAPARAGARPAAAPPRPLRPALRAGHLHAHPLRRGARAQRDPARDPGRGDPRARVAGGRGLGRRGRGGRAPAAAAGSRRRRGVSDSFLFYDLETFGADPRRSRIAQFAALRTDEALQEIEPPVSFFVRPADDLLPSPAATLVTGITPQRALAEGVAEADAFARIFEEMARPRTCTLGYNSLRFDDEFVRCGLFRNFFDPYEREWKSGNCRWDLLDVMRLAHALRPDGIEWPRREDGATSFRLEHLAVANGVREGDAHEALSDVRALIGLARKLRAAQPRLWEYALGLRDKRRAARLLDAIAMQPVLHVSQRYPAARLCAAAVLPLAVHPSIATRVIVFDLGGAVEPLLELEPEAIAARLYLRREEDPDGSLRIPLKEVHVNRCPALVAWNHLQESDFERLAIDRAAIEAQAARLRAAGPELAEKIRRVYAA